MTKPRNPTAAAIPPTQHEIPRPPPLDPATAAWLAFEPVVRKVLRPDGWTPELQRDFIAFLVATGSPQAACVALGKNVTGIQALYKNPAAHSFRAAWDNALALGRQRLGLDAPGGAPHTGPVPGINRRQPRGRFPEPPEPEPELSQEDMLAGLERLASRFLRKIVVERTARLAGQIVSADFYLRQITHLEVMFDLRCAIDGVDAWDTLRNMTRGGHRLLEVVDTPFVQYLDAMRREYWESEGEPMRPVCFRDELLDDHGDHRTAVRENTFGGASDPPPGVDPEDWRTMSHADQAHHRETRQRQAAQEQVEWEAQARRSYEERRDGDASS